LLLLPLLTACPPCSLAHCCCCCCCVVLSAGFLSRFEGSQCPAKLLEEITLVDTPGVLSGEKQRLERNYNFQDVCEWFAARCDLILLLFDPYKLDISDEFKKVSRQNQQPVGASVLFLKDCLVAGWPDASSLDPTCP
jgi:hypothetical protein